MVDEIVLAAEVEILRAMKFLWERMKLVVEPSGAVPLVPLLERRMPEYVNRVGVIISGGNVDISGFFNNMQTS